MATRLLMLPFLQLGHLVGETITALRGESPHRDVPPMEPSAGVIGEALLDRSFTLAVNLLTGLPNANALRGAHRLTRETADAIEAAGWLEDPRAFHRDPPPIGPVELEDGRGFNGAKLQRYRLLSFESGYRPQPLLPSSDSWLAHQANRRAAAYVLEHEDKPDAPWLVCVHGFGMGTPVANFAGFNISQIHHELGLNVLMPVLPLHGPRSAGRLSGGDVLSPDMTQMLHIFSQALSDIRQMLGWLRERGAEQIGLWGVSLGGYTSALVAGFERDLECVIAGIPPTDFASVARDNQPWVLRGFENEMAVDWMNVRATTHIVSPLSFAPQLPRERLFIYAGIADRVVRPDQARALWRHWDEPEILWYSGGHVVSQWKPEVQGFIEDALDRTGMLP